MSPTRPTLAALAVAVLAAPAAAASFPCAKAGTSTEKAICADPAVSALDERLAAAYKAALQRLGMDANATQAAVKADQKEWLAERNACGADAACLRTQYERRVAVLSFKPDPGAPSPADPFVGRFGHGGFMEVATLRLRDGTLAVSVSGAEPKTARWTCNFEGIGQLARDGSLVVGTPDAEGNGLVMTRTAAGVRIPETEANYAVGRNWCGMNGLVVFDYARVN